MSDIMRRLLALLTGNPEADRAVPPTGFTARLTTFTAFAMAFLAVFALAFMLATDRLADRWSNELARSATLRVSAPADEVEAQVATALRVLGQTPGIAEYRRLSPEEQALLLEPWLGPGAPIENLPLPQIIDIAAEDGGFDAAGLRARLQAEVPGAVLDDHSRWRAPLLQSAQRLRLLGLSALALIGGATAAMVMLAAQAALAANAQVIRVLRLVGARDSYIAGAFIRRFTLRALLGAAGGTLVGVTAILLMPDGGGDGGFLTGLSFAGADWLWSLLIPILAAMAGYFSTRAATRRHLREQS
ncbi:cell division protein FtsX [Ketogulonicigenium vulgare]|uniref:cell division protein FtsX n=1 Tax=Ketogulonicigenium vulgare TaxID=92945 RepID=UPI0001E6697C|nr:FtsX-like permease family protein [Ketogulonicigenium vulgare]ADO41751.1 cell division protein FtsX [Ketogulonicigenium vulgare Y25]ALJ80191.1 cell division protein FtsX [Ketogulonicigenium vulgare]ANW33053.1 cell division protein FtsX [Ketogulonicigenium vulgare]AOZ53682.1 cell division protein FtsX [Ketogulonicigenium vulgare]